MAARAARSARSGSEGLGPQDLGQRVDLAIWRDAAAKGKSKAARMDSRERQSGKPGPEGTPRERRVRRSGGKVNPNEASR